MSIEITPGELDGLIAEIAIRLADKDTVSWSVQQVIDRANYPTGWEPISLAMGPLGNAILFLTLHRSGIEPSCNWKALADDLLESCFSDVVRDAAQADSLFGGAGGALLAYVIATSCDERWRSTAELMAENLADQTLALDSVPDEGDLADSDYDLISGRAGTLVAISIASQLFRDSDVIMAAQNRIFDDIGELLCRGKTFADTTWIDPKYYPHEDYIKEFPSGYFNLGMAHGLPGLLVALASAKMTGRRAEQQHRLIEGLARVIQESASEDGFGLAWPTGCPRDGWRTGIAPTSGRGVPNAWCYGAPGISVALARAGVTLGDKQLIQTAHAAMLSALNRAVVTGSLESMSPTFCHGIAGILACSVSVLGSSGLQNATSPQYKVAASLLSKANKDCPLIFQDFEEPDQYLDNPTVLQGAAGIALALTLVRNERQAPPGWQNMFGLD